MRRLNPEASGLLFVVFWKAQTQASPGKSKQFLPVGHVCLGPHTRLERRAVTAPVLTRCTCVFKGLCLLGEYLVYIWENLLDADMSSGHGEAARTQSWL